MPQVEGIAPAPAESESEAVRIWRERTAASAAVAAEHAPTTAPERCAHPTCRHWPFSASLHGLCRAHEQVRQQQSTAAHLETLHLAEPMAWPAAWAADTGGGGGGAGGVDWAQVRLVRRLPGGEQSTGVFLALLAHSAAHGDGGILVIKPGSMFSATEVFCALLYERLGIKAPRQRVVRNGQAGVSDRSAGAEGGSEVEGGGGGGDGDEDGGQRESKGEGEGEGEGEAGEYDALCEGMLAAAYVDPEDREAAYHLLRPAYGKRAFCTVSEFCRGEPLGRLAELFSLPPPPAPPIAPPSPAPASPAPAVAAAAAAAAVAAVAAAAAGREGRGDDDDEGEAWHPRAWLMHELGVLQAADVLVNNGDRLPAIHRDRRHRGNPGNLLLLVSAQQATATAAASATAATAAAPTAAAACCAIDNTTTGISDPGGAARYLECVGAFAADILDAGDGGGGGGGGGVADSGVAALVHAAEFIGEHGNGDAATRDYLARHGGGGSSHEPVQQLAAGHAFDMRHLRRGLRTGMRRAGALLAANQLVIAELKRDVAHAFDLNMTIGTTGVRAGEGGEDRGMGLAWRGFELIDPRSIRDAANKMQCAVVVAGARAGAS